MLRIHILVLAFGYLIGSNIPKCLPERSPKSIKIIHWIGLRCFKGKLKPALSIFDEKTNVFSGYVLFLKPTHWQKNIQTPGGKKQPTALSRSMRPGALSDQIVPGRTASAVAPVLPRSPQSLQVPNWWFNIWRFPEIWVSLNHPFW